MASTPPAAQASGVLSRSLIVRAAISYVDQYGLQDLTMRRLGGVLGVEAMAIYHHVNGREDLLESIVTELVDSIRVPPREPIGPSDGWQAFLQHVAHAVRTIAVEHPRLFPLVATRPPAAPWLRPPLRSLPLVEDFLDGLLARGVTQAGAVRIYQRFAGFLLGHLLLEVAEAGADTGPDEEPLDEGDAEVPHRDQQMSLDHYPTIRRLERRLRQHDAEIEFEMALESLLVRLDHDLSA